MYSNGSYTYSANSEIAGLDEGESVNDIFTYSLKDDSSRSELGNTGSQSDYVPDDKNSIGTLTITINGVGTSNNAPVTTHDTGYIDEDATLTVPLFDTAAEDGTDTNTNNESGDHTGNLLENDSDADDDSISIVNARVYTPPDPFSSAPAWNSLRANSSYSSNYIEITGTYGTLRVGSNGTYRYVADQDAADALDPETPDSVYDNFEIQISDDAGATSTSILSIYVTGVNDDPVAVVSPIEEALLAS